MRRLAIVVTAAAIALVAVAAPAWAHVEIEPASAPKGSDAVLTFVVPNEESNTTTTEVSVQFPQDHPIADASVAAMPGWKTEVKHKKLTTPISTDSGTVDEAVDTVTWTATGAGIGDGEFAEFKVSVGLPDADGSLSFPTIQTYANGDIVRWIEQPTGGTEPEHPVPQLTLSAGDNTGSTNASNPTTTAGSGKSDDTGKTLGIIGIIVGAVGVVLGAIALATRRRTPTS